MLICQSIQRGVSPIAAYVVHQSCRDKRQLKGVSCQQSIKQIHLHFLGEHWGPGQIKDPPPLKRLKPQYLIPTGGKKSMHGKAKAWAASPLRPCCSLHPQDIPAHLMQNREPVTAGTAALVHLLLLPMLSMPGGHCRCSRAKPAVFYS